MGAIYEFYVLQSFGMVIWQSLLKGLSYLDG